MFKPDITTKTKEQVVEAVGIAVEGAAKIVGKELAEQKDKIMNPVTLTKSVDSADKEVGDMAVETVSKVAIMSDMVKAHEEAEVSDEKENNDFDFGC